MRSRELTRAESLVAELAQRKREQSQFEDWQWKASVTFHEPGVLTRTTTETSVLGFKSRSNDERWDGLPNDVARAFHSFLANKRDEAHLRVCEIETELEAMS